MSALWTSDPDKAAFKVATSDPSKGFGAGTLFGVSSPEDYTEQQKNKLAASGAYAPTMKKGGKVRSASQRADGCCVRGKTRA
jgi:hypothetical protein